MFYVLLSPPWRRPLFGIFNYADPNPPPEPKRPEQLEDLRVEHPPPPPDEFGTLKRDELYVYGFVVPHTIVDEIEAAGQRYDHIIGDCCAECGIYGRWCLHFTPDNDYAIHFACAMKSCGVSAKFTPPLSVLKEIGKKLKIYEDPKWIMAKHR